MILRRVAEHFRKQQWTAIGIDLVITVLGVFIGLQFANWNEERIERQRAHSYLERIHGDLETDLATYRDRLAFWGAVLDYGRAGLSYAERGDAGGRSQWELVLAYFQASQVAEYFTTNPTYEELKSAGELSLISEVPLRNALASYYTYAGNPTLTERPLYRVHVRGLIPLDVQTYIWANCYRTLHDAQQLVACPSPISEAQAAEIVGGLRNDRALMQELRYWMSQMTITRTLGADRQSTATALVRQVETAL
jgi:hypothetical protein